MASSVASIFLAVEINAAELCYFSSAFSLILAIRTQAPEIYLKGGQIKGVSIHSTPGGLCGNYKISSGLGYLTCLS